MEEGRSGMGVILVGESKIGSMEKMNQVKTVLRIKKKRKTDKGGISKDMVKMD